MIRELEIEITCHVMNMIALNTDEWFVLYRDILLYLDDINNRYRNKILNSYIADLFMIVEHYKETPLALQRAIIDNLMK